MDKSYELLAEKEELWAKVLMEVLTDYQIPYLAQPVYGAGLALIGGAQERIRVYVPRTQLALATTLKQELFSAEEQQAEGLDELYALSLLWAQGLVSQQRYGQALQEAVMEQPEDDVLLELEACATDLSETEDCFLRFGYEDGACLDSEAFGRALFKELRAVYAQDIFELKEFGRRCYSLWRELPKKLHMEPFLTLCYADDYLLRGEEQKTRALYEKAFAFYQTGE